jgi:hypothetical protein
MSLILEAVTGTEQSSAPTAATHVDLEDAPPPRPVLARVALGVVAALALVGAFNYYHTVDKKNRYYQDPKMTYMLGIQEDRFSKAIAMVPPESVVGYMADHPMPRGARWPTSDDFIFTAVRYAVAPRALVPYENVGKPDWVLGNFTNPFDLARIEREKRLRLVEDFGSGILLFRSE